MFAPIAMAVVEIVFLSTFLFAVGIVLPGLVPV